MNGKDAGKQGIINGVIKQRNWVFVEGLNTKLIGYNMSKNASVVSYLQREQPLVVHRDVKLIDPTDLYALH
jgi:large subunit ribosomal protein L24